MHISGESITEDLLSEIDRYSFADDSDIGEIFDKFVVRTRQIIFHETYHFWQGAHLPFLFRYALNALRASTLSFQALSHHSNDYHSWGCVVPILNRLDWRGRIGFNRSVICYAGDGDEFSEYFPIEAEFTPIDLLECAASLAEYQYSVPDARDDDHLAFLRWSNRNPTYLKPYYTLCNYFEDKSLALRMCLPLINACFETTGPVRAFAEFAARLWVIKDADPQYILTRPEADLFQDILETHLFEGPPDSSLDVVDPIFTRLTADFWIGSRFGSREDGPGHIMLSKISELWQELAGRYPQMRYVMSQPRRASQQLLDVMVEKFQPPLRIFAVHADDRPRVFLVGNREYRSAPDFMGLDWNGFKGLMVDVLTMHSAVRRASEAHYEPEQRTCHHRSCPEFSHNYCNAYPIVPPSYEDCGFIARMDRLILNQRRKGIWDRLKYWVANRQRNC